MVDVKVEISGQMNVPNKPAKLDFCSIAQCQNATLMELIQQFRKYLRPWPVFLNTSNFKTAASFPRLTSRCVQNLSYFRSNYIFIFIILMIYCLITSPLLLIVLLAVGLASYRIRKAQITVPIFGHQLSSSQQIIAVNIASIPILFLVGAGAALFWTLGASCFVIGLHSIFYNIDSIVTEEAEGFLSEVV